MHIPMSHVIVRKIAISRNPVAPAAPPGLWDQEAHALARSLPIDYEMEGHLLEPVRVDGIIRLRRFRRNDVRADGYFESSEIVAIREPFVETRNSIYLVEVQPKSGEDAA